MLTRAHEKEFGVIDDKNKPIADRRRQGGEQEQEGHIPYGEYGGWHKAASGQPTVTTTSKNLGNPAARASTRRRSPGVLCPQVKEGGAGCGEGRRKSALRGEGEVVTKKGAQGQVHQGVVDGSGATRGGRTYLINQDIPCLV